MKLDYSKMKPVVNSLFFLVTHYGLYHLLKKLL